MITVRPGDSRSFTTPRAGDGDISVPDLSNQIERRYATVEAKRRLHQGVFRHLVLKAYGEKCVVCSLPGRELVEAAHIVPDRDQRGRPEVSNGLAMCALHHDIFDADLLGITPDGVVQIAPRLLTLKDGRTLEHAIIPFHGERINPPSRKEHDPKPDLLELRYADFQAAS